MGMGIFSRALLVLAAVVWAGTASAASIVATDANADPSEVSYALSDMVTVEVTMDLDPAEVDPLSGAIASMFFRVEWTDNLTFESATYATLPGTVWLPLDNHGELDPQGRLQTAQYEALDEGGVFTDQLVVTVYLRVNDNTLDSATITPVWGTGDIIGGAASDGYPDYTPYFPTELPGVTIHVPEPSQAALALAAIGTLGFLRLRRRERR